MLTKSYYPMKKVFYTLLHFRSPKNILLSLNTFYFSPYFNPLEKKKQAKVICHNISGILCNFVFFWSGSRVTVSDINTSALQHHNSSGFSMVFCDRYSNLIWENFLICFLFRYPVANLCFKFLSFEMKTLTFFFYRLLLA